MRLRGMAAAANGWRPPDGLMGIPWVREARMEAASPGAFRGGAMSLPWKRAARQGRHRARLALAAARELRRRLAEANARAEVARKVIEQVSAERDEARAEVEAWRREINAEMPPDYKDYWDSPPIARPTIARLTLQARDTNENHAWTLFDETSERLAEAEGLIRGLLRECGALGVPQGSVTPAEAVAIAFLSREGVGRG